MYVAQMDLGLLYTDIIREKSTTPVQNGGLQIKEFFLLFPKHAGFLMMCSFMVVYEALNQMMYQSALN